MSIITNRTAPMTAVPLANQATMPAVAQSLPPPVWRPVQATVPRPPHSSSLATPATSRAAANSPNTLDLLHGLPLLGALPEDDLAWLARRVGFRRLRRGAVVVEQGTADTALQCVISGRLHAVRRGLNDRPLLLEVLGPGDHFGERGLLDEQPRTSTVRCVEATQLLVIHQLDFAQFMASSSAFRNSLHCALTQRLRSSNQRIAVLALSDVRGCVIRHLLEVSEDHAGQRVVRAPVRRQTVADRIGASREMVGRVLKSLTAAGKIEARQDGSLLIHCADMA